MTLWIPGRPVPWARTASVNGRRMTPQAYREWKRTAEWVMKIKGDGPIVDGPVALDLLVTSTGVEVDVSSSQTSRVKYVRGDIDNYAKAVMDAGNGLLYSDDRQVTSLTVTFGER